MYTRSKTRTKDSIGPFVHNEGNVITDTSETANVLNDFFTSMFTGEDVDGLSEPAKAFKKVHSSCGIVLKKLMHLNQYKAPGVTG